MLFRSGKSSTYGFERTYPIIIPIEDYNKGREIAATNDRNASKSKSIYFCEKLIRCSCGRHWIAQKSSILYYCYARYIDKDFKANYSAKTKCSNSQSINLNIIDSLAWFVASYWETHFILDERDTLATKYNEEIALLYNKVEATKQMYLSIDEKRNRLAELYAEHFSISLPFTHSEITWNSNGP